MLGSHMVKSWSSTQGNVSLSSGEAEYYGMVKAASVGLGIQALLRDLGHDLKVEIFTDATAAKGIAGRRGLGKTRHIEVHYLWVQERVGKGHIILKKVWGGETPADLLTKNLTREKIQKYMNIFGLHYQDGRSAGAPALASDVGAIGCIVPNSRW